MTDTELQALAALVADELERRAAAKSQAEAIAKSQSQREGARGWSPPASPDWTARFDMPANTKADMVKATPNELLRQVARDRHVAQPTGMAVEPAANTRVPDPNPNEVNRTGWREAVPLRKWRS
jgi:hypothetical protein